MIDDIYTYIYLSIPREGHMRRYSPLDSFLRTWVRP